MRKTQRRSTRFGDDPSVSIKRPPCKAVPRRARLSSKSTGLLFTGPRAVAIAAVRALFSEAGAMLSTSERRLESAREALTMKLIEAQRKKELRAASEL